MVGRPGLEAGRLSAAVAAARQELTNPVWKTSVVVHREPVLVQPSVWMMRRHVANLGGRGKVLADPLVLTLWDTLPKAERRRSRLFACCSDCPVRFTKQGAIADAVRHKREPGRHAVPTRQELVAAGLRHESPPPELDPGYGDRTRPKRPPRARTRLAGVQPLRRRGSCDAACSRKALLSTTTKRPFP
jgi:hypothetical protein